MEKDVAPARIILNSLKKEYSNKTCVVDARTHRAFSFKELELQAAKAAAVLYHFGVYPGKTVSLLLKDDLNFLFSWLGSMILGAVINPIDCTSDNRQVAATLDYCETFLLITEERFVWDPRKGRANSLLALISRDFRFRDPGIAVLPNKFEGKNNYYGSDRESRHNLWIWDRYVESAGFFSSCFERSTDSPFQIFCTVLTGEKRKYHVQYNDGKFAQIAKGMQKAHGFNQETRSLIASPLSNLTSQYAFAATLLSGGTSILASREKNFLEAQKKWHADYLL